MSWWRGSRPHFPFTWCDSSLPYLGVFLSAKLERLYHHNYPPMLKKLSDYLAHWARYKMSWIGRINSVKMTLLPRILYLFRSLPRPQKDRPPILSPSLSHSMALCDTLYKKHYLTSPWLPLAHIFHNPQFQPGMNIEAFRWWLDKGLYRIGQFFINSGPISLKYCISKLEMPASETFRYYQLSHFLRGVWKSSPTPL